MKKISVKTSEWWKKILISIIVLLGILMRGNVANAWLDTKPEKPKPWMVKIYVIYDFAPYGVQDIIMVPITQFILSIPTKKVVENPTIVEKLEDKETNIETTDSGRLIEGFFDWLILQGIM